MDLVSEIYNIYIYIYIYIYHSSYDTALIISLDICYQTVYFIKYISYYSCFLLCCIFACHYYCGARIKLEYLTELTYYIANLCQINYFTFIAIVLLQLFSWNMDVLQ